MRNGWLSLTDRVAPSWRNTQVTVVRHDLDDEELREKSPEGYTTLPDEVYKKLEVKPATFIVKEHHIAVYKGKDGSIVKGTHPIDLLLKPEKVSSCISDES